MLPFFEHMPNSVLDVLYYMILPQQCYKMIDHVIMKTQGWCHRELTPFNCEWL